LANWTTKSNQNPAEPESELWILLQMAMEDGPQWHLLGQAVVDDDGGGGGGGVGGGGVGGVLVVRRRRDEAPLYAPLDLLRLPVQVGRVGAAAAKVGRLEAQLDAAFRGRAPQLVQVLRNITKELRPRSLN